MSDYITISKKEFKDKELYAVWAAINDLDPDVESMNFTIDQYEKLRDNGQLEDLK